MTLKTRLKFPIEFWDRYPGRISGTHFLFLDCEFGRHELVSKLLSCPPNSARQHIASNGFTCTNGACCGTTVEACRGVNGC